MKITIFLYLLFEIAMFAFLINYAGILIVTILSFGTTLIGVLILRNLWKNKLDLISSHHYSFAPLKTQDFSDDFFSLIIAIFFITPGFLTDFIALFLLSKKSRNFFKHIIIKTIILKLTNRTFNDYQDDTVNTTYEEVKD